MARALRGKRSQTAFNRRLGYRSNTAYRWESGRCFPTAATFFAAYEKLHGSLTPTLSNFFGRESGTTTSDVAHASREGVAALLDELRGGVAIVSLARRAERSRFSVARWLSGEAEPRLPDFLRLFEASSRRVLDFVTLLFDASQLPSIRDEWQALRAARRLAYELPWSHAVLRALELADYQALPGHHPGWIAKRIGITREQEDDCLDVLSKASQIEMQSGLWRVRAVRALDTSREPEASHHLKQWAMNVARERHTAGARGTFGYNLFTVSEEGFEKLAQLQVDYFRRMQAIIAESEPGECVGLYSVQLLTLDPEPPTARRERLS